MILHSSLFIVVCCVRYWKVPPLLVLYVVPIAHTKLSPFFLLDSLFDDLNIHTKPFTHLITETDSLLQQRLTSVLYRTTR